MDGRFERIRRVPRVLRPRVWRTLLDTLTVPENDYIWTHVQRVGTDRYFEDPCPWWAPGAVDELLTLPLEGMRVIEWGAGGSTLWLLSHGCKVTSIETDEWWADQLCRRGGDSLDMHLLAPEAEEFLPDVEDYSLAIIDGGRRVDVAQHLLARSFPGVILWDDTQLRVHREGVSQLADKCQRQRHFAGLDPGLTAKLTSIFWMA